MNPQPTQTAQLADDTIDTLLNASDQAEQEVSNAMREAEAAGEKAEFFVRFRERFRELDQKFRGEIVQNLENLLRRSTSASLETLKQETDAMQMVMQEGVGKVKTVGREALQAGFLSSVDQVKGIGNKMEEMTDVMLPLEWTKYMSRGQKIGFSAVTGIAAAFAVYKIGKWLVQRGKKSVDVAQEEAKKTKGGFLKKLAVGLGLGALAFGSYKAYELYKEADDFKGMVKKMAEEITDKVENGVQHAKEELGLKGDDEEVAQGTDTPDYSPEELSEAEEVIGIVAAKKSFALQYDISDKLGLDSPKDVLLDAKALITAASKDVKMNVILDAMESGKEGDYIKFIDAAYEEGYFAKLSENGQLRTMNAAKFVVEFFRKYKKQIENVSEYVGDERLEDITVGHSLNFVAHLTEGADTLARTIALYGADFLADGAMPDIEQLAFTLFEEKQELFLQHGFEHVFEGVRSTSGVLGKNSEEFKTNCKEVAFYLISNSSLRMKELEAKMPWDKEDDKAKLSLAVRNYIQGDSVVRKIKNSLMIPLEEDQMSEDDKIASEMVDRLIDDGDIVLSDMYQVFHLIESGNEGPMLTVKLISILMKNGMRDTSIDRFHKMMNGVTSAIASGGLSATEIAANMNISPEQSVEFQNISRYAKDHLSQKASDALSHINEFRKKNPELFWISTTVAATVVGPQLTKAAMYMKGRVNESQLKAIMELGELRRGSFDRYIREYKIVETLMKRNPAMTEAQATAEALRRVQLGKAEAANIVSELNRNHVYRWFMRPVRSVKDWWASSNLRIEGRGYYKYARGRRDVMQSRSILRRIGSRAWRAGKFVTVKPVMATVDVVQKTPEAVRTLMASPYWPELARQLNVSAEYLLNILRQVNMPPQVAKAFARSQNAMLMLLNGIKTTGVTGAKYLTILGTKALPLIRVGGKAVVGIDAAIAAYEIYANQARIDGTDNAALKDFYEAQNAVYAMRGITGTALAATWMTTTTGGLSSGGIVLPGSAAASGMATSGLLFPIAFVAIGAGAYSAEKINAETEAWLKTDADWRKQTPGDLMRELYALPPGHHGYWMGAASGTRAENWGRWVVNLGGEDYQKWEQENWNRIEDANDKTRYLITKAYMAQMTHLPQREGESDASYRERYATFQKEQLMYIIDKTDGRANNTLVDVYENAELHAEIMDISMELQKNNMSQILTVRTVDDADRVVEKDFDLAEYANFKHLQDSIDGISLNSVIATYKEHKKQMMLVQTNIMRELSENNPQLVTQRILAFQSTILMNVRHWLPRVERQILEADFDGIIWGESRGENVARYSLYKKLRSLLDKGATKLLAAKEPTVEMLDEVIAETESMLQSVDPLELQKEGEALGYAAAVEQYEDSSPFITDYRWIMERIVSEA